VSNAGGVLGNPLLLTERDVRAVLPMPDLIAAMETALSQFSAGAVRQPVRSVIEVGEHRAFFGVMPAALDDPPAVGAKLVTVYERNHHIGLPSHLATIILLDHATGALRAVLDGRYITEARTAAVSAVSVRHLARADARVLAVIGSGVQARSHVEAIRHVRTLSEVRVWSRDAGHRDQFAADVSASTGIAVHAATGPADAVRDADLIVLATSSRTPVIDDADVAPGTHVVGVGACRPDQQEMPGALIARARVFVDSRAAAMQEAGDVLIPMRAGLFGPDHVAGELGEVVSGKIAGRQDPKQITIFKSLGLAVEDVVAAGLAVSRAEPAGLGKSLSLS
jgi:ornithine cyclodeaminase